MDTWMQRQLEELECLQAIYCEEGQFRLDGEARDALSKDGPPVSLAVRVFDSDMGRVRLAAVLPKGYPGEGFAPVVWLEPEASGPSKVLHVAEDEDLCGRLQEVAQAANGEECLLQLIQEAEQLIRTWVEDVAVAEAAEAAEDGEDAEDPGALDLDLHAVQRKCEGGRLGRRAMFSHHIIAPSKRQAIKQWAMQLDLGGLAKVGWPGVIIVEGDERNVAAYVDALSRLRWKHFVVRGEQMIDAAPGVCLDSLRVLPTPLREYPPDAMSEFSAHCRNLGVEELFLAALKIGGGESGSTRGAKKGKKR
ncbi:unnamed protein product [Effrenium voratum]|nr:unnamed protein product [Effrenium voratum]